MNTSERPATSHPRSVFSRLGLLVLLILGLQAGAASAATIVIHDLPQRVLPQRILDQSPGNVVSTINFRSQLTGFPWNLSRNMRANAFAAGAAVTLSNWVQEEVRSTGGLVQPALGAGPQQECLLPLSTSYLFICNYSGTNRWPDFTEADTRYYLNSKAIASATPVGLVGSTVSIGGSTVHLGTIFPGERTGGLPGASWTPRCIADRPHWQSTQQRCTCDPEGTNECDDGDDDDPPPIELRNGCFYNEERMLLVDDMCQCKPEFPVPVLFAGLLVDCHSELENAQRWLVSVSLIGQRPRPNGSRVEYVCTVLTTEVFNPVNGQSMGFESESDCRYVFIDDGNPLIGENPTLKSSGTTVRHACWDSDGRIWQACPNDPTPHVPIDHPPIDLRSQTAPCQDALEPDWCEDINPPVTGPWGSPPSHEPDLLVEQVSALPSTPVVGDEITFSVRIANAGTVLAPSTLYRVSLAAPNGATYERDRFTGSLIAGGDRLLSVRTIDLGYPNLIAGAHVLTLTVDPQDDIEEANEYNNETQMSFDVGGTSADADLRVTALSSLDPNPTSGSPLSVRATVRNSGGQTAVASRVLVVAELIGGDTQALTVSAPALSPGQSATVIAHLDGVMSTGRYLLEALADSQDDVTESDETNNLATRMLDVANSQLDCLPCTTGEPNNQIGDQFCFDAPSGNPLDGIVMTCRGVRSDGSSCADDPNNPNGWENTGSQCPDPATLPQGWHPNRCGSPNVCPGANTP